MGGKFVAGHPFQCGATEGLGFTLREPAKKESQVDSLFRIGVRYGFEQCADFDLDAEFFVQFAGETLLEGFAGFTFSARKFPQATEMRVDVALGDEQFTGTEDKAGADFDDFIAHLNHQPILILIILVILISMIANQIKIKNKIMIKN